MISLGRLAACIAVVLVAGCNSPTASHVTPRTAGADPAANETPPLPPPPPSSTGGGHFGGSGT
jgi:hypothetical protein